MPALTGAMLPQSSALTNRSNLLNIGNNIIATSGVLTPTSANAINGFLQNLQNSSAVTGTSATTLFNAVNAYVNYGTSAQIFVTQILGASSCIDTMMLQAKAGFQVSS